MYLKITGDMRVMKEGQKYNLITEDELKAKDQRIKELEKAVKDVCDVIHNEGIVSKWKIANWLEQALRGK